MAPHTLLCVVSEAGGEGTDNHQWVESSPPKHLVWEGEEALEEMTLSPLEEGLEEEGEL